MKFIPKIRLVRKFNGSYVLQLLLDDAGGWIQLETVTEQEPVDEDRSNQSSMNA